jgi:hypothetical protein
LVQLLWISAPLEKIEIEEDVEPCRSWVVSDTPIEKGRGVKIGSREAGLETKTEKLGVACFHRNPHERAEVVF